MPKSLQFAIAFNVLLLSMLSGCSQSPPPAATPTAQIQPNSVPAGEGAVKQTVSAIQSIESDSLFALLKQKQWAEFDRQLNGYLTAHPNATPEADRRLLELSNGIQAAVTTSDDLDYFAWRVKASRLILSKYQPLSTEVSYLLSVRLASQRGFTTSDPQAPDAEHRLSDARLMLRELKRISDFIDPQFDPTDLRNLPMVTVGVPGGEGRYEPGTNPDNVQEPQIRENYKKAIRENEAKTEKLLTQRHAKDHEKRLRSAILKFIRRAYGQPPSAMTELKDLLKELAVDEEVQKEVVTEEIASIPRIEQSLKENRENGEKLAKLREEGLID